jgi:tRNA threonylcarbamoyladenosine biosynthesis protein TsaE
MRNFKSTIEIILNDEAATQELAQSFTHILSHSPASLFLHGDLGAGKTCFTRYLLASLGYTKKVKSPTYTIVEPYTIDEHNIYHFDLYRLNAPEELEILGIRDYLNVYDLLIVEWAEKGQGLLPSPDLEINFTILNTGRQALISCSTEKGLAILKHAFNI